MPTRTPKDPYVELVSDEGDTIQLSLAEAVVMMRHHGGETSANLRKLVAPGEELGRLRATAVNEAFDSLLIKLGLIDSHPMPGQ